MTILYIYEYDTKVSYKDNRIVVNAGDNELSIPCENIEGVILFGNIQLTGKVITFLMEREIPVTWLSKTGKFFGRLVPTSNVNILRQRAQFQLGDDKEFCINLSRKIIIAKIRNQKTILSRYNRETKNGKYKSLLSGISKLHKEGDLVRVYKLNDFVEITNWGEYIDLLEDDVIIF